MKLTRRSNRMLVEPPAVMLTDLAFNLVIFFVVCASTEPESGRKQEVPNARKEDGAAAQMAKNIEVALTRTTVAINGDLVKQSDFSSLLRAKLAGKTRKEERIVVLKSTLDTPYQHWIEAMTTIEQNDAIIKFEVQEGREIIVK